MRITFTRDQITPNGATLVAKTDAVEVSIYDNSLGRPSAIGFVGKSNKPAMNFRFNTADERDAHVAKFIKTYTDRLEAHKDAIAKRRAERSKPSTLKVGDILSTSWGYDQTNVNFYQVTDTIGNRTVIVREIAHKVDHSTTGCDFVVAVKDKFLEPRGEWDKTGKPMKRLVSNGWVKISDCQSANLWDGKPQYETALGWGH